MKPSPTHLSPTLPAVVATGIAVSLSVFLLAGAGPQDAPTPLLPVIGGAAVHAIGELPGTSDHRTSKAVARQTATAEPTATTTTTQPVGASQRQHAASKKAHRPISHRKARVDRAVPSPVSVTYPAPTAPVAQRQFSRSNGKGKARGHSHSNAHNAGTAAAVAGAHGHVHGKAHGHGHRGVSRGHAKKAPAAPHHAPAAPTQTTGGGPPSGHGGGNGHGGKK